MRVPLPLHLRLLALVLLVFCAGWIVLWLLLSASVSETAARDIDRQLSQAAFSLMTGWNERGAATRSGPTVLDDRPGQVPEFELRSSSGQLLVQSRRFPLTGVPAEGLVAGFTQPTINGTPWRVLTVQDDANGRYVRVAVPLSAVAERGSELSMAFVRPLALVLPGLGIVIGLGIWQVLRPLRQITRKLSETEVEQLEPLAIDLDRVPREMRPPVLAINRLIQRVRQALASHRAFTSAIGHELRTPLAGFKSQVQVALRSQQETEKDRSLSKLASGIEGMERIVDHLLILARVDPVQPQLKTRVFNLASLVEQSLADREGAIQARTLTAELALEGTGFQMRGDATLIESLVGNLLDNAIQYSPVSGRVLVQLSDLGEGLELRVSDQGPGIPEAQRAEVFENFYRAPEQRKTGSGLGLGIVRAIAQAHGGSVSLIESPQSGACIRVWLPSSGPAAVQTVVR